jgi:hypothetical protein
MLGDRRDCIVNMLLEKTRDFSQVVDDDAGNTLDLLCVQSLIA